MTKNTKILIGAGLLIAGLWWWNKTKKEKKSGFGGKNVKGGNGLEASGRYTPNSWYQDKNGKWHWIDGRGHIVS